MTRPKGNQTGIDRKNRKHRLLRRFKQPLVCIVFCIARGGR
jgi:hypothetical protein